jgi:hypothetical protein
VVVPIIARLWDEPHRKAKVGMKSLSSFIAAAGLLLPGTLVLAADAAKAPASKAAPAPAEKKAAGQGSAKATAPAAPSVVIEPDGLAFGMSAEDVAKVYDRWWDKQFIPRYQKANPGPKTRELDFELSERKKVLRRVAIFDGRSTSFDNSDFREEFAHGSDETMISSKLVRHQPGEPKDAKGTSYTRRCFFFQDKLWKTYDEYRLEAGGPFGADFKEATARVEATLKGAKRTRGPQSQFDNVVFDAGDTRVRLVKLPADKVAVVRSDSVLTKAVLDRRAQQAKAAGASDLDDDIQAVIR